MNALNPSPSADLARYDAFPGDTPALYQGARAKALSGVASPRQAIKAKCLECVGYVRADITNCTCAPGRRAACPLWAYRPYQRDDEEDT